MGDRVPLNANGQQLMVKVCGSEDSVLTEGSLYYRIKHHVLKSWVWTMGLSKGAHIRVDSDRSGKGEQARVVT